MLVALLIPLLACPPTSIPARNQQGGLILASPYGIIHELQPTAVASRSLPVPDIWLALWDLDASLAAVEAQLELDVSPDWVPWIAWVLEDASDRKHQHGLIHALASSDLAAEHLAWWRSITPDPIDTLPAVLARAKRPRTRALLTTALALTEYARSCPVPVDIDGSCRTPGTDLLLRRRGIPLESALEWTKLARAHWALLDLGAEDLATRALWAELELAVAVTDYESLLDLEMPADLSFVVEDWRRDSGVPAWEAEYERQLARAEDSRARVGAFFASTMSCARTQLDLHDELLWIDARSSGVVLLRSARILIAFAEALDGEDKRQLVRILGEDRKQRWFYDGMNRQSDPIYEQAEQYLELCLEHSRATLDEPIERACLATLARIDSDIPLLVEFTGQPRSTSTMLRHGVVGSLD